MIWALLVALLFTAIPAWSFPVTVPLDLFNRADEDPLANGHWLFPIISPGTGQMKIVSNAVQISDVGGFGGGSTYWSTPFGPDTEVCSDVPTPTADNDDIVLFLRMNNPGGSSLNGYIVAITRVAGVYNAYDYQRFDNAVATELGSGTVTGPTLAAGDALCGEMVGNHLVIVTRQSGVWAALDNGVTDNTYTGTGFIGFYMQTRGTNGSMDNFWGGTITPNARTSTGIGR